MELMVIKNFSNAKGSFKFGDIIKCTPEEAKLLKEQRLVKEYTKVENEKLEVKKETAVKKKRK